MSRTAFTSVLEDLRDLRAAYGKAGLLDGATPRTQSWKLLGGEEDVRRFQRRFLLLDALIRNRVAGQVIDAGPVRHVAVFGGNNVGKSTVVNILAKRVLASASPEGGHTRHAQGFARDRHAPFGQNEHAFRGLAPLLDGPLPADRFDVYALSALETDALPANVAIWDTPDCDAVGSARYVGAVIEAVAAADVVVYVTSVDKYAVADLVEWVFHLNDAGIPIVECLNKTPRRDRDTVILKQGRDIFPAMALQLGLPLFSPPVVALRMLIDAEDESDLWAPEHAEAETLRETVLDTLARVDRDRAAVAALDCVARHLDAVLEPVRLEIYAERHWDEAVRREVDAFVASYERDYLMASASEPMARLSLEILNLLDPDIRGLKQAMSAVRWATRWPSRLLIATGRYIYYRVFAGAAAADSMPPELKVYSAAHANLLNGLAQRIQAERNAPRHHPFWETLDEEWVAQIELLSDCFSEQMKGHMDQTDREIKVAAHDIFDQLRRRPATLNMLRAARVAANVGGVLVGFLIPGHGSYVFDLLEEGILTPALMSATEAATTAGVDAFVSHRKQAILEKLKRDARDIGRRVYRDPLIALAAQAIRRGGAIGVNEAVVERLPRSIAALRADLAGAAA